jgi:hypothetical protein
VQSGSWDEVSSYLVQQSEIPAANGVEVQRRTPSGVAGQDKYAARRLFTVKEPKLTIVAVIRNKYNDPVEISDAKIRFVAL